METRDSRTGPSMVNTTGEKEFPGKCRNIVSDNFRCLGWNVAVLQNDFPVHCSLFWTLFDKRMIQIHPLLLIVTGIPGFRNSWYTTRTETTECTWLSSFLKYSVLQSMYYIVVLGQSRIFCLLGSRNVSIIRLQSLSDSKKFFFHAEKAKLHALFSPFHLSVIQLSVIHCYIISLWYLFPCLLDLSHCIQTITNDSVTNV